MQPFRTTEITQPPGTKNHATSQNKTKIMQPVGEKNHATALDKKNATSCDKKKTMQPFGTKKITQISGDKKDHTT